MDLMDRICHGLKGDRSMAVYDLEIKEYQGNNIEGMLMLKI